jgi:hypothetical protein
MQYRYLFEKSRSDAREKAKLGTFEQPSSIQQRIQEDFLEKMFGYKRN